MIAPKLLPTTCYYLRQLLRNRCHDWTITLPTGSQLNLNVYIDLNQLLSHLYLHEDSLEIYLHQLDHLESLIDSHRQLRKMSSSDDTLETIEQQIFGVLGIEGLGVSTENSQTA